MMGRDPFVGAGIKVVNLKASAFTFDAFDCTINVRADRGSHRSPQNGAGAIKVSRSCRCSDEGAGGPEVPKEGRVPVTADTLDR